MAFVSFLKPTTYGRNGRKEIIKKTLFSHILRRGFKTNNTTWLSIMKPFTLARFLKLLMMLQYFQGDLAKQQSKREKKSCIAPSFLSSHTLLVHFPRRYSARYQTAPQKCREHRHYHFFHSTTTAFTPNSPPLLSLLITTTIYTASILMSLSSLSQLELNITITIIFFNISPSTRYTIAFTITTTISTASTQSLSPPPPRLHRHHHNLLLSSAAPRRRAFY